MHRTMHTLKYLRLIVYLYTWTYILLHIIYIHLPVCTSLPLVSHPAHRRSTVLVVQRTLTFPLHSLVHRRGSHLGDTGAGEWTTCWNPHGTRDPLPFEESGMGDAAPRNKVQWPEYCCQLTSDYRPHQQCSFMHKCKPVVCNTPRSHWL